MENTRGIHKRKNGRYEAFVMVKSNGNRSKKWFKAHVGTFSSVEEAIKARTQFIRNLK